MHRLNHSAAHATASAFAICGARPIGYSQNFSPVVQCDRDAPSCVTGVACPAGSVLLSGGVLGHNAQIEFSDGQSGPPSWLATWYRDSEDLGDVVATGLAIAICVTVPPTGLIGFDTGGSYCAAGGPSCEATATCPTGTVLVGGGFYGDESKVETMAPITPTTWLVRWYPATAEFGPAALGYGEPTAYCATGTIPDPIFTSGFE